MAEEGFKEPNWHFVVPDLKPVPTTVTRVPPICGPFVGCSFETRGPASAVWDTRRNQVSAEICSLPFARLPQHAGEYSKHTQVQVSWRGENAHGHGRIPLPGVVKRRAAAGK